MDAFRHMTFRSHRTTARLCAALFFACACVQSAGCSWFGRGVAGEAGGQGSTEVSVDVPAGDYPAGNPTVVTPAGAVVEVRGQDCGDLPPSRMVPANCKRFHSKLTSSSRRIFC